MGWADKDFEERMRPHIDAIYKGLFNGRLEIIKRCDRNGNESKKMLLMDMEMAIDTHLTFYDGSVLTFQEKTLRHYQRKWKQFTFEYYNDPKTRDKGEWFKLAAQLYFFGYANKEETGYSSFWILNVAKLRTRLMSRFTIEEMERRFLKHNKPPAKANFFAIPFSIIEDMDGVVLYKDVFCQAD